MSGGDSTASGAAAIQPDEHVDMSQALVDYIDPDQMIAKAFEAMSRLDKAAFCSDLALKVKTHGYVYVAWNPSFPTLIKIGATSRQNPFIRLKELSTAGVPGRFELVCCMATMKPFQLEKQIHAHFIGKRSFGYRKEFFEVSVDEVVGYFDQLAANGVTGSVPNDNAGGQDRARPSKKRGVEPVHVADSRHPGNVQADVQMYRNDYIRIEEENRVLSATLRTANSKLQRANLMCECKDAQIKRMDAEIKRTEDFLNFKLECRDARINDMEDSLKFKLE